MMYAKSLKRLALSLSAIVGLSGCITSANHYTRSDIATRIATPAFMVDRTIPAGPFNLMAYERMHQRFKSADIYLEGDGESDAWMSPDPTPDYPVALHLAAYDKADNVAYIARPCQYSGMSNGADCKESVWQGGRYSPAVMDAYNKALDNIIAHYDIRGINLIAFDGAAAIAADLIKERSDIISLRTVAGKLDGVAADRKLAQLPQRHFIGGQDDEVLPPQLHNYLQALGPNSCVHYEFIQENEHEDGWAEKWPQLLEEPVQCDITTPKEPPFDIDAVAPHYIYHPRDTSSYKENSAKK